MSNDPSPTFGRRDFKEFWQESQLRELGQQYDALKRLAARLLSTISAGAQEGSTRCQQYVSATPPGQAQAAAERAPEQAVVQGGPQRVDELKRQNDRLRRMVKERLATIRSAAKEGSAHCQNALGWLYEMGDLAAIMAKVKAVEADEREAYRWYRKAAEQGYADGQKHLGLLLVRGGKKINKDVAEGVRWLKLAAEQGLADGQFFLAQAYSKGWGVTPDPVEAVRWFQRAADQGHSFALALLASCYERGKGIEQDCRKAVEIYERAIQRRHPDSRYYLAELYREGRGVERDYSKALELYRACAEERLGMKRPEAKIRIGEMYEQGLGVNRDLVLAREWYQRALKEHSSAETATKAKEALKRLDDLNTGNV